MKFTIQRHGRDLILLVAGAFLLLSSCRSGSVPVKPSAQYNEVVRAFYVGLAALEVGHDVQADAKLAQVTQLAANEPAGWANWAILALRQRNYDQAAERMEHARALAPDNDQIQYLLGLLESSRGRQAEAIVALRKAVDSNPKNLIATFKLAEEIERQGDAGSADFQQLMQKILSSDPNNLAALLELSRIAAKRGDADTLKNSVARIAARSADWPPEVQQQLAALQAVVSGPDPKAAATRTSFLRNALMRVPEYRESLGKIKPPPGDEAVPFSHFLRMETPDFAPAPADATIGFDSRPIAEISTGGWNWIGAITPGISGAPVVAVANGREVRITSGATLPFPGGPAETPPTANGVLAIDFTYDFKTDLALAGAGGLRLMKQEDTKAFTDVTAQTKLPASVINASYTGAWAADIEADGDLDIVLGSSQGLPTVLRNNGDGTFAEIHPFAGVSGLKAFAWADLDEDGDPDAALIDAAGRLQIFSNERQGQFRGPTSPANISEASAIAVADLNNDGVLDLVVVRPNGSVVRVTDKNEGQSWDAVEVVAASPENSNRTWQLKIADLDNNGGIDLILISDAAAQKNAFIYLADEHSNFKLLGNTLGPDKTFDVADLTADGRLDLIGLSNDGRALEAVNHGTKNYHWQVVRPHASQAVGDQRINPFGVGGEMEIRSGLVLQKQPITGPLIHFGLGEQNGADVVRVVWPNGTVRAEFEVKGDQEVVTEQRLKASCPFLFAFNGKRMEFVKDAVPWGSAIGLRINTLGSAKIAATGEWYKISRDQLAPHDGYYDLRITAELWEVYYYDYIALMTVDHPPGTEIYVDERFVIPPAKLGLTTVATPHDLRRATDDNGKDVTELLSQLDGRAVDSFGQGQYQGLTRDHYLEIDLGDDVPAGPLYLVADGSIHDTESSLNVAITQGDRWHARGLSLEVPDGRGGWIEAQSNLGFPAGRKKTILFNLTKVFRPNTEHRVRIRTNLEIYWDRIRWAAGAPGVSPKLTTLDPTFADLHYRGYSVITRPNGIAPEVPDYERLSGSKQIWRDLIGYYTRYGDISELLKQIDDRYVIVASGDEMSLRFPEQPEPPSGWLRDFVIVGDGWIKDGDYNSTFSKTVLPLPYHAKNEYISKPGALEDEEVYRCYPADWQNYHTRYITPEVFQNALRQNRLR